MEKLAIRGMEMVFLITMVVALALLHTTLAQTTHQVGDLLGWLVPPTGETDYISWTSTKTFTVGDILVFNFMTGTHTVAEVSKEAFGTCNIVSPISVSTIGPTSITLAAAGEYFYLCTFPGHCDLGQKLAINVSSSPLPKPPPAVPKPTPISLHLWSSSSLGEVATPSTVFGGSRVYNVGNGTWIVPETGPLEYQAWTSGKTFKVGDVLEFNFANGAHDVAEVTKAAFDSCDISSPLFTISKSPATTTLRTSGEHYYVSTLPSHCSLGQKLAINVTLSGSSLSPSASAATTRSTISIPLSNGFGTFGDADAESPTPLPENSAPTSVAALPITWFFIALAYLYYFSC